MIQQWIYTSSNWNQEMSNGFKTFSHSPNLSSADIEELRLRCGNYMLPNGVPASSTPEMIQQRCPVRFQSFTLPSGKHVLARTCYLGQGWYDHRWGNFLAHALIFPTDKMPCHAMALYDSPLFWRDLPEDAKRRGLEIQQMVKHENVAPPPLLPEIAENTLLQQVSLTAAMLREWLADDSFRVRLNDLLLKFLKKQETHQPMIVYIPMKEVPKYFAALSFLFHPDTANQFQFSTYLNLDRMIPTQYQDYSLIAVETIPGMSQLDVDFRNAPEKQPESLLITASRSNSEGFQRFWENFPNVPRDSFETVGRFFLVLQGQMPISELQDLKSHVAFAEHHAVPQTRRALQRQLMEVFIRQMSPQAFEPQIGELVALAQRLRTTDSDDVQATVRNLLECMKSNGLPSERFLACFRVLMKAAPQETAWCWLGENIPFIQREAPEKQPTYLVALLLALSVMKGQGIQPVHLPIVQQIFKTVVLTPKLRTEYFQQAAAAGVFFWAWQYQAHFAPLQEAAQTVTAVLKQLPNAMEIRRQMLQTGYMQAVFDELMAQLPTMSMTDWIHYTEQIFQGLESYCTPYCEQYYPTAIAAFTQQLPQKPLTMPEMAWLTSNWNWIPEVPPELRFRFLNAMENSLPLTKPDGRSIAVVNFVKEQSQLLSPTPSVAELLAWGDLQARTMVLQDTLPQDLARFQPLMGRLPAQQLWTLCQWLLPCLLMRSATPDVMQAVVKAFQRPELEAQLVRLCSDWCQKRCDFRQIQQQKPVKGQKPKSKQKTQPPVQQPAPQQPARTAPVGGTSAPNAPARVPPVQNPAVGTPSGQIPPVAPSMEIPSSGPKNGPKGVVFHGDGTWEKAPAIPPQTVPEDFVDTSAFVDFHTDSTAEISNLKNVEVFFEWFLTVLDSGTFADRLTERLMHELDACKMKDVQALRSLVKRSLKKNENLQANSGQIRSRMQVFRKADPKPSLFRRLWMWVKAWRRKA